MQTLPMRTPRNRPAHGTMSDENSGRPSLPPYFHDFYKTLYDFTGKDIIPIELCDVHPKAAIRKRNRWMVDRADHDSVSSVRLWRSIRYNQICQQKRKEHHHAPNTVVHIQAPARKVGEKMDREQFIDQTRQLIRDPHNENMKMWNEWSEQCVDDEQYAYFRTLPREEAVSAWLDAYYASLYFVRKSFGVATAKQVVDLASQRLCLYPFEMREAAKQLRVGVPVERLRRQMLDGCLVLDDPWPTIEDVNRDKTRARAELER